MFWCWESAPQTHTCAPQTDGDVGKLSWHHQGKGKTIIMHLQLLRTCNPCGRMLCAADRAGTFRASSHAPNHVQP